MLSNLECRRLDILEESIKACIATLYKSYRDHINEESNHIFQIRMRSTTVYHINNQISLVNLPIMKRSED